jgi:arabinose-5-phosphate isomerase
LTIEIGKNVIIKEAEALEKFADSLGKPFLDAVDIITAMKGKLVVAGMGKSGLIGKKIAATFTSTGTPAYFVHPAEGVHGDLGLVREEDVIVAMSNSGESQEIVQLIPFIKRIGSRMIVLTGKPDSTLGNAGDVVISIGDIQEVTGLVPTVSTTLMLALGDALAVSTMHRKGFTDEDFAKYHPGGSIGMKLKRVDELMVPFEEMPVVFGSTAFAEVLAQLVDKRLGVTAVLEDGSRKLIGCISNADIIRALNKGAKNISDFSARDMMTASPKVITKREFVYQAMHEMENFKITSLFVTNPANDNELEGVVTLHSIVETRIV